MRIPKRSALIAPSKDFTFFLIITSPLEAIPKMKYTQEIQQFIAAVSLFGKPSADYQIESSSSSIFRSKDKILLDS